MHCPYYLEALSYGITGPAFPGGRILHYIQLTTGLSLNDPALIKDQVFESHSLSRSILPC